MRDVTHCPAWAPPASAPEPRSHVPTLGLLAAMRAVRWCSHRTSFEMELMGCLCSSSINYRLLSLREINSGTCVTDLAGLHLLPVARVGGVRCSNPASLQALTRLQPLLKEGDLLAQGLDPVQLLQGVGQAADGVCADVLGRGWHEVVEGGQHQLELLQGEGGALSVSPVPGGPPGGVQHTPATRRALVVFKGPRGWSCCPNPSGDPAACEAGGML